MHGFKKIDKIVRKRGNSLTLSLTKQLKEIGGNEKVFVVWSDSFILITKDDVFHPIQHVIDIDRKRWVEFVGFCVEHNLRYTEAIEKAITFFMKNYKSLLLRFKEGFWDKDIF